jgi:hypothetical protein
MVDEKSGVQDGYYAKCVYAETPSGRNANWQTLQWIVDALFPDGSGVRFTPECIPDEGAMRERIAAVSRRYRKRQREQYKVRTHLRSYASAKEARTA